MDCSPHRVPLSMGFSRQEYWSGLPFPSSRPRGRTCFSSLAGRFSTTEPLGKPAATYTLHPSCKHIPPALPLRYIHKPAPPCMYAAPFPILRFRPLQHLHTEALPPLPALVHYSPRGSLSHPVKTIGQIIPPLCSERSKSSLFHCKNFFLTRRPCMTHLLPSDLISYHSCPGSAHSMLTGL